MPNPHIKQLLSKEMTRKDFLGFTALTVASLFGVFGVITELLSHAATPYVSGETETGSKTGAATTSSSSNDSQGEAVQFGSVITPLFAEEFTDYDDTNVWWPNLPYFGPGTGAKDPAGTSYNAWQGENCGNGAVYPFTVISDTTATNGSALRITCRKTTSAEQTYIESRGVDSTSALWVGGATTTRQYFTFTDSIYVEWRARFPVAGQGYGMFPALWMKDAASDGPGLPYNSGAQIGGELDMVEIFGMPQTDSGFFWSTTSWVKASSTASLVGTNCGHIDNDVTNWHTYAMAWTPTTLRFYQDGVQTGSGDQNAAYYNGIKMDIRLNYTICYYGPDSPNTTTPSSLYMDVDYVHVYPSIPSS
jgi:hypothetical protein